MSILTHPFFSQAATILLVLLAFYLGIWLKYITDTDKENQKLTRSQIIATGAIVFIVEGIPLSKLIHDALYAAETLFVMLSAFVPAFSTGFLSREQIKKIGK